MTFNMFAAHIPSPGSKDALVLLSWQDFEHLVSEHYRDQGFRVERAAPVVSLKAIGQGLDLRLHRGSESVVLVCPGDETADVDAPELSELLSTMLNEASTGGILLTRRRFTQKAQTLARRQPRLQLVDADLLRVMLKLPDHLDASLPPSRRKTRGGRRTAARTGAASSALLPVGLGVAILLLLGLFGWKMTHSREATTNAAATTAMPDTFRTQVAPTPPSSAMPRPVRASRLADEKVARELAARERLRDTTPPPRQVHQTSDDAMQIMERNTRAVGAAR
ncbi:restriction endonuclease [Luteibacter sp. PPL201]|uniref:Restriction endonuclease n=1 Tax=Luteibacter sahnii TaxID=3021977 RepID=A0ABT6BCH0_9GAMM|nr:restriction endonuclease [Luteibacter sp. PPL193]MDY1549259.1 restriction endonuclease [Luteibacter sp. PPL193]